MDEAYAAVTLTAEQHAKRGEAMKRYNELFAKVRQEALDILTDAQKAQIGAIGKKPAEPGK